MSMLSLSFSHTLLENMRLIIVLLHWGLWRLGGISGDEVKSVSVMEGHCVTLHTNAELQTHDVIEWMFGDEIIAEVNKEANLTSLINERFKNHVEIEAQSGSLIITNITTLHTGLYKGEITRNPINLRRHFNVTVYARLPVPVITRNSSQCSSSSLSSKCSVLCSVLNASHVSLSWYKGSSLLSSISVSELYTTASLHLEVDYEDTNTHMCVLNNPITNQTQCLDINQLCHKCSESCCCCGSTEAVIRLVVSVLVGVATVAVLVYDVRDRREEQKKKRSDI